MPAFNLVWFLIGLALGWMILPRITQKMASKTA